MILSFRRQLIISFLIIIASVAVATAALYFLSGDIVTQVAKVKTDRALIDQQSGALDVLADLKEEAPQAAAYQSSIDQILPTQDDLIGFGDWLNKIAAIDQVSANASFGGSLQPPTDMAPGQSTFSLEVDGSLPNIISFLNDIEAKAPGFLLQITAFNLAENGTTDRLTAQVNIFFRP